ADNGADHDRRRGYTVTVPVISAMESPDEALAHPAPVVHRLYKVQAGTADHAPIFAPALPEPWSSRAAPVAGDAGQPTGSPGERSNQPYIGTDFSSFPGLNFGGAFPPDPTVAVGPQHVLVAVNSEVGAFRKDGTKLW